MNKISVIGISGGRILSEGPGLTGVPKMSINTDYSDAVFAAGGLPVIIPPVCTEKQISDYVSVCDGIIISGGMDISPILYGENPINECGAFDLEVDKSHIALIKETMRAEKPLLGICRGMQLINVALGGTLYQDISSQIKNSSGHRFNFLRDDVVHKVNINENSSLFEIIGDKSIYVNSLHHQAVKNLCSDAEKAAISDDGIIEAFTIQSKSVTAVQWHPEMLMKKYDSMMNIFKHFVDSCNK